MANPLKLLKLKPTGFQLIQELPIDAPPKKVWQSLLNFDKWFGFEPPAERSKSTFEPWPGGRWFTEARDGTTQLHMIVTRIEPEKLLRLSGPMGLSHLPVNNAFIFELQPKSGGKKTLLRFCQRTFGLLTSDIKKNFGGGWKKLLPQLKELAERG
ncbi:MAG TPA: SRPBCC domain-containing protein [Tepidisphaeraceae bacterium]|jgi:uncharacterized protein YndB with AHSA1/START domain|nr:SRPBCC domain-containing protein [Tepidisphaeraceae bacterium]